MNVKLKEFKNSFNLKYLKIKAHLLIPKLN